MGGRGRPDVLPDLAAFGGELFVGQKKHELVRYTWTFPKMRDPQVTMGFNTQSWSKFGGFEGTPILGHLHIKHETGWWFGTFFSHILGISSSQLTFIFFRAVGIPPTR